MDGSKVVMPVCPYCGAISASGEFWACCGEEVSIKHPVKKWAHLVLDRIDENSSIEEPLVRKEENASKLMEKHLEKSDMPQ